VPGIHQEKHFQAEIIQHLCAHGWVEGHDSGYDKALAMYPEDVLAWVQTAHPEAWTKLEGQHGANAGKQVIERLTKELESQGTLAVLRHGFKMVGLGEKRLGMAQFKPAFGLNPDTQTRYAANRLRVVKEVTYSLHNGNRLDLVLFVNGLPMATVELKTDSTQSVWDAIKQYQTDRPPVDPVAKLSEPLLAFKKRCVVHFAVSTSEVAMATRLEGPATVFRPFNLGFNEGKGNPPNPAGCKTAYLWEQVWQRDAWLHILGGFVHLERKKKKLPNGRIETVESMIFPRLHQWIAVQKLVAAARADGAGKTYLVQHSAGSGKSNTIAWTAHHLASLHDVNDKKVFDSVIVITDRTVLDQQLQETIYQFEHKAGVVERITDEDGAKSGKLAEALLTKKPIIIVTIQTFGFVLKKLQTEEALRSRVFAVIADEAHSSQTGSAAANLRKVLGKETPKGEEGAEISFEDLLEADIAARTRPANLTYFAFTATPKSKTMELFGTPDAEGIKRPFDSYTMQQAIEEGYILDVLKNYTNYKVAWRLAHNGKDYDDAEVDKSEAVKALVRWVRLHPVNIGQKVAIIVEHFRQHVAWRLNGQAKAMVVTGSRKEAVRFKLAMESYIAENHYKMGVLVAFSGEVNDPEMSPDPFTETGMNPGLKKTPIPEALDGQDYTLLVVADKYQTGFDQPKLVAMYVDKRLAGVATVQTMSRLNRTYEKDGCKKDWTVVVDFVNDPEQILADFQKYYRTAILPDGTDPHLLYDLQTKLDASGIYLPSEVDAFAKFYWNPKGQQTHMELQAKVTPALQRFTVRLQEARDHKDGEALDALKLFVKDIATFCRMYEFLSQIVDYGDSDLEKRYVLFKHLTHPMEDLLRTENPREVIDLSQVKLTHHSIRPQDPGYLDLVKEGGGVMEPVGDAGSGLGRDKVKEHLSAIISKLNEIFEGQLTDNDVVNYAIGVRDKLMENDDLALQAANNSKDQFAQGDIKEAVVGAVIDHMDTNNDMANQVLNNPKTMDGFMRLMVDLVYEGFEKRRLTPPLPIPPIHGAPAKQLQ
jgi:type I restriction enzyme, R subunit